MQCARRLFEMHTFNTDNALRFCCKPSTDAQYSVMYINQVQLSLPSDGHHQSSLLASLLLKPCMIQQQYDTHLQLSGN